MISSRALHKLWDHCLGLEGFIQSHIALDLYQLQGQVPEMILSGQKADKSLFVECRWYEFIRWYDVKAQFPQPRERYGRWLGPYFDIGPAMTAKILKENGQVLHLSTYRPLNEIELSDSGELATQAALDKNIADVIGQPITQKKLKLLDGNTPVYPATLTPLTISMRVRVRGNKTKERNYHHTRRIRQLHQCPGKPSKRRRDDVRHSEVESKVFR